MKRISDENRFLSWPNRVEDFETMNSLSPRFNQKTSEPNYGHSDATKLTPNLSIFYPNKIVLVIKWANYTIILELIAYEKLIWLYNNNSTKSMSQQKWRMNIQKFEVEAEESNKKSQDHLNSMPQSLPTQKTENFEFSRNLWKSGICHFWSSVTHHWWNRIFRIAHFCEWLLCVNTAYPDGLRFYDFQILSSGFLVKIFSRATSRPHLASVHMLTEPMATRVLRARTRLFVEIEP